jgi:hypothetical protein
MKELWIIISLISIAILALYSWILFIKYNVTDENRNEFLIPWILPKKIKCKLFEVCIPFCNSSYSDFLKNETFDDEMLGNNLRHFPANFVTNPVKLCI